MDAPANQQQRQAYMVTPPTSRKIEEEEEEEEDVDDDEEGSYLTEDDHYRLVLVDETATELADSYHQDTMTSTSTTHPDEYNNEKLVSMLLAEDTRYPSPGNYLELDECIDTEEDINEKWRKRLCEWMFEVADHFGFDREVVSIAFNYFDRGVDAKFTPTGVKPSKKAYQLHAVVSLYLALKVHGETDPEAGQRLKMKISAFHELSRGFFNVETIEQGERELLSLLKWQVNPPTCAQFVYYLMKQLPTWSDDDCTDISGEIFDNAKYLTELSVFRSKFTFEHKPSSISYAAVLCAVQIARRKMTLPVNIQGEFLRKMNHISPDFTPSSEEVKQIQVELRKLAPDLFPTTNNHHNNNNRRRKMARTVSFLDAETANSVAAVSPRVVSPVNVSSAGRTSSRSSSKRSSSSGNEPNAKRGKIRRG